MPKPPYPVSGDPIASDWGTLLTDFAGEHMRFVRNPTAYSVPVFDDVAGDGAVHAVELLALPMNDPNVYAADMQAMFRVDAGAAAGQNARLFDGVVPPIDINDNPRLRLFWTGVGQRGGSSGTVTCLVGGTNRRSIYYEADTATGTSFWLWCLGWWIKEQANA